MDNMENQNIFKFNVTSNNIEPIIFEASYILNNISANPQVILTASNNNIGNLIAVVETLKIAFTNGK